MAKPSTRDQLIDHCLRRLGAPVIEINVDIDQLEDRTDDTLQLYQEYHSDAVVRTFLKHQVTSTDITNGYIPIPSDYIFIKRVLPINGGNSSSGIVESASFKLPVINIGTRQSGKLIPKNVINSNNKYNNIKKKVEYGLSNGFKNRIKLIINPYQVKTKTDISKILMKLTKIDNLLIKS